MIEFAIPHLLQVNASHDFLKLAISKSSKSSNPTCCYVPDPENSPHPKKGPIILTVPSSGLATFHEPAAICGLFFSANVMFREESSHSCL
jgi:hypothetical protein